MLNSVIYVFPPVIRVLCFTGKSQRCLYGRQIGGSSFTGPRFMVVSSDWISFNSYRFVDESPYY